MSQLNRYEFVGSFLRPERLKEARKNYELNNITNGVKTAQSTIRIYPFFCASASPLIFNSINPKWLFINALIINDIYPITVMFAIVSNTFSLLLFNSK